MRRRSDDPPFVVELLDDEPEGAPVVVGSGGDGRRRPRLAPFVATAAVAVVAAIAASALWSPPEPSPLVPEPPDFEEELTERLDRCDAAAPVEPGATCLRWASPGSAVGTAGGLLLAVDGRTLRALDPATGGIGWTQQFDHEVSVTAGGDTVVIAERLVPERMELSVLAAADGRRRWTATVGGTFGRPVIGGGLVVVHDRHRVIAFEEREAVRRWEMDLPSGISAPPLAADDLVVIGTNDGTVWAIDVRSGQVMWKAGLRSRLRHPAVALGDAVVVASASGLVGLDRFTGEVIWTREPAYPPGWLATAGDVVLVETGPSLLGLDDDHGGERWRARLSAVPAEEAVAGDVVYLAVNRSLVAVDVTSGRLRWQTPLFGQWPVAAPVATPEGLFVEVDGEIVALS